MRATVLLIAASITVATVEGAPAARSRVAATPVPEATAIRVDGELNDAIWQTVPPSPDSSSASRAKAPRRPSRRRPASPTTPRRSMSRFAHSIRSPSRSWASARAATRTRRPTGSACSWTRSTTAASAFEFAVNPAGVKQDSYWFNDTNNDQGWDAVWDVAVSRSDDGWRAEFRIPFSQLRFRPSETLDVRLRVRAAESAASTRPRPGRCSRRARTATCRRSANSPASSSIDRPSGSRSCPTSSAM